MLSRGALDGVCVGGVGQTAARDGAAAARGEAEAQLRALMRRESALLDSDRAELAALQTGAEGGQGQHGQHVHVQHGQQQQQHVFDDVLAAAAGRARSDAGRAAALDALRLRGHVETDVAAAQSEPQRGKTHWDHVLEEAVWLAREVHTERSWKQKAARNVAHAAKKGLEEMSKITGTVGHGLKKDGDDELALRKIGKVKEKKKKKKKKKSFFFLN